MRFSRDTFRSTIALAALVASAGAMAQPAPAHMAYPTKAVRMIVPFAAGGGTDIVARLVAQELNSAWGQAVVVDNRGGGGGTIGMQTAAKSNPDGYTMVMVSLGLTYVPALYPDLTFDPRKDFAPISRIASQPFVYVVTPTLGVNSIKDLVAMAKAKPGELRYGSGGAGGASHLGTELLKVMTGTNMVHIPYKGTAPALTAMLGGEIHFQLIGIATALPQIKTGKMRGIAVSGTKRSAVAPDVPTVAESGIPGYDFDVWYGMLFPKGTPRPIVAKTNADIAAALKVPAVIQRFASLGLEPAPNSPAEFSKLIDTEVEKWSKVVKAANIRLN